MRFVPGKDWSPQTQSAQPTKALVPKTRAAPSPRSNPVPNASVFSGSSGYERHAAMLSRMSLRCDLASSKGMDGLSHGSRAHSFFHCSRRREIHLHAEQVAEPVLQMRHADQGKALRAVEVGHEIDIRPGRFLTARNRAKQAQMNDAGSPQLRLVQSQRLDDRTSVHTGTLTQSAIRFQ